MEDLNNNADTPFTFGGDITDIPEDDLDAATGSAAKDEADKKERKKKKKLTDEGNATIGAQTEAAKEKMAIEQGYTEVIRHSINAMPEYFTITEKTRAYLGQSKFYCLDPGTYKTAPIKNVQLDLITGYTALPLCSPLRILGKSEDVDNHSVGKGRLIEYLVDNQWVKTVINMSDLFGESRNRLIKELADKGVTFVTEFVSKLLPDYLQWTPESREEVTYTTKSVGWHGEAFVLPNESIGGDVVFLKAEGEDQYPFSKAGTFEGWRDIAALAEGSTIAMLLAASAFAGPLMRDQSTELGTGLHVFGATSKGKTTAACMPATAWGHPKKMVNIWRTTDNALENVAECRSDALLILDEIQQAMPEVVSKATYMLGNGQGKARNNSHSSMQRTRQWRIVALSTGEKSIASYIGETGKEAKGGQAVRFMDIPLPQYKDGAGVFAAQKGMTSQEVSDHIKAESSKHYGHAAPMFIAKLIELKAADPERVNRMMREQAAKFETDSTVALRGSKLFSMIAVGGELAIEFGILPWAAGSAARAVEEAFEMWKAGVKESHVDSIPQQVKGALREWIEQGPTIFMHGSTVDAKKAKDPHGYWQYVDETNNKALSDSAFNLKANVEGDIEYIIPAALLHKYVNRVLSIPPRDVRAALLDLGIIDREKTYNVLVFGNQVQAYRFLAKNLSDGAVDYDASPRADTLPAAIADLVSEDCV